ncbi:hypothetical protein ACFQZ8_01680, partial [Micromonospora azadirachtae]
MFGKLMGPAGTAARGALLLVAYFVLLAAGALGWAAVFAVAGLVALVGEYALARWSPATHTLLEKVGLRGDYRQLARDLATVLLVVAAVGPSMGELSLILLLPGAVWLIAVFAGALNTMIDRRNPVSALVRNIDLGPITFAPRPPAWTSRLAGDRLALVNIAIA